MVKKLKDFLGKKNPLLKSKADQDFAKKNTSSKITKNDKATENDKQFTSDVPVYDREKNNQGYNDQPDTVSDGSNLSETAYEKGLDDSKPIKVHGVKGMKSKPFTKTFKSMKHFDKWHDANSGDVEITHIHQDLKELNLNELSKSTLRRYADKVTDKVAAQKSSKGRLKVLAKRGEHFQLALDKIRGGNFVKVPGSLKAIKEDCKKDLVAQHHDDAHGFLTKIRDLLKKHKKQALSKSWIDTWGSKDIKRRLEDMHDDLVQRTDDSHLNKDTSVGLREDIQENTLRRFLDKVSGNKERRVSSKAKKKYDAHVELYGKKMPSLKNDPEKFNRRSNLLSRVIHSNNPLVRAGNRYLNGSKQLSKLDLNPEMVDKLKKRRTERHFSEGKVSRFLDKYSGNKRRRLEIKTNKALDDHDKKHGNPLKYRIGTKFPGWDRRETLHDRFMKVHYPESRPNRKGLAEDFLEEKKGLAGVIQKIGIKIKAKKRIKAAKDSNKNIEKDSMFGKKEDTKKFKKNNNNIANNSKRAAGKTVTFGKAYTERDKLRRGSKQGAKGSLNAGGRKKRDRSFKRALKEGKIKNAAISYTEKHNRTPTMARLAVYKRRGTRSKLKPIK